MPLLHTCRLLVGCLTALLVASAGGASPIAARPMPVQEASVLPQAATPADFALVAESANLRLAVNQKNAQFLVVDKRSGKQWFSNPQNLQGSKLPPTLQQQLQAAFSLNFTDRQRQVIKLTNNIWEKTTAQYTPVDGGVRVDYHILNQNISFALIYRITDSYLEVTLPDDSIKEEADFHIVSISPMPFFGAAGDEEQGYLLLPDGSGALARFKKVHPEYLQGYNKPVYGPDTYSFEPTTDQPVAMPVFGMVVGADAYVGVVTKGEYDASISVSPSGYILNYNRTAPEFIYRRTALLPRGRGKSVQKIDAAYIPGVRQVRYIPLTGPEASYVGMARAYRDYLVHEVGVQPAAAVDSRLNLRLFMAIERKGLFFPDFVPMTTFAQAEEILRGLRQRGVTQFDVTLEGWEQHGYAGEYPHGIGPAGQLGGTSNLDQLTRYARQNDIPVYVLKDYLAIFKGDRSFSTRSDVLRGSNQLPIYDGRRTLLLNPVTAFQKFAGNDINQTAAYQPAGLELQRIADTILYDGNRGHALTREQFVQANLGIADDARKRYGQVRLQGSNVYALGHADVLTGVPVDSSRFPFSNDSVPFYELVVHGLVSYTGLLGNARSDPRVDFLRAVEYGTLPSFELTYRNSTDLRRTVYNQLYSAAYTDWVDAVAQEYQDVRLATIATQTQQMTNHEELASGVFRTTYADGTRVVVNYNATPYQATGAMVAAYGFAVMH